MGIRRKAIQLLKIEYIVGRGESAIAIASEDLGVDVAVERDDILKCKLIGLVVL